MKHTRRLLAVVGLLMLLAVLVFLMAFFFINDTIIPALLIGISSGVGVFIATIPYSLFVEQSLENRRYTLELLNEYVSRDMTKAKIRTFNLFNLNFANSDMAMRLKHGHLSNALQKGVFAGAPDNALLATLKNKTEDERLEIWADISMILVFWGKLSRAYQDGLIDTKQARTLFKTRFETHFKAYLNDYAQMTCNPYDAQKDLDRYNDYWTEHVKVLTQWLLEDTSNRSPTNKQELVELVSKESSTPAR